jgi:heptaprenyl diphosphate synthase
MPDFTYPKVAAVALRTIGENVPDDELRSLLEEVLLGYSNFRMSGKSAGPPAAIRIPLLVHSAVTGDPAPAEPLAAALLLLYLGIDILDDLMDGTATPYWQPGSRADTLLVTSGLTGTLPYLAIANLEAAPAVIVELQKILGRSLVRMAAGQLADVKQTSSADVTPEDVERSVILKSGDMVALLAELGACLGGADPQQREAWASWGRALGTADQLRTDCAEIMVDPPGPDVRNGTRTLPIANLLALAEPAERRSILDLLDAARSSPEALEQLRSLLRSGGALYATGAAIEWHCNLARDALERAGPREPAAARLREAIANVSLALPKAREPARTGV